MKKYELLNQDAETGLWRIKALRSFGNVKAGDIGGWVASEHNLSHDGDCWVYCTARVHRDACVYGDARVLEKAIVGGSALIGGSAVIGGRVCVDGFARISGSVLICGSSRIGHFAYVHAPDGE